MNDCTKRGCGLRLAGWGRYAHTHLRLLSTLMVQPQAGRPKMSSEPPKPPTGESRRYAILEMALTQPELRSWQAIGYAGRDINTRLPYC